MTNTIATLATALSAAFVSGTRDNGDEFRKLADGSPEWMTDAIRAGHLDMMPNDASYTICEAVADGIVDMLADDADMSRRMMAGYYCEAQQAWGAIVDVLTEQAEEGDA